MMVDGSQPRADGDPRPRSPPTTAGLSPQACKCGHVQGQGLGAARPQQSGLPGQTDGWSDRWPGEKGTGPGCVGTRRGGWRLLRSRKRASREPGAGLSPAASGWLAERLGAGDAGGWLCN